MEDRRLYTTKQIAEIYNVSPCTITQNWIKQGLRHKRGPRNSYVYRLEWVDEFIEETSIVRTDEQNECSFKVRKTKNSNKKIQFVV